MNHGKATLALAAGVTIGALGLGMLAMPSLGTLNIHHVGGPAAVHLADSRVAVSTIPENRRIAVPAQLTADRVAVAANPADSVSSGSGNSSVFSGDPGNSSVYSGDPGSSSVSGHRTV